ncbi:class I SAM-dependent methyltransferase [Pseudohalocynthiibacter aestuariivivens]|nr:class I SAM-dependent methyltransferase [Pseudohalocynthiibacter aestuariivivens]QIE46948.1 class I SAM-dependent methyltransferase [Pseudohalocynthiibacter aestuariivivens]
MSGHRSVFVSADDETLSVYGAQAARYAAFTDGSVDDPHLSRFMADVVPGGRVLDLGCGPGAAAAQMAQAGLVVDATDAVPEMVDMAAAAHPGVTAWIATFDDIAGVDLYDGIWANFSLLHAPRALMPAHLAALRTALKPGGRFHIGLKTGKGEKRDAIGRLYTYYEADELSDLLTTAGFSPRDQWTGADPGLDGTVAPWVVIAANG